MSGFLLICFSILSIQNVSCQYHKKRNTNDPNIAAISYSDGDMVPYTDPYNTYPASHIPEPYVTEYAAPVGGGGGARGWPEYRTPSPYGGNYALSSVVKETIVEEPAPASSPLISAVGFGGEALSLALSPLLEAGDADVALLMFTKVKSC